MVAATLSTEMRDGDARRRCETGDGRVTHGDPFAPIGFQIPFHTDRLPKNFDSGVERRKDTYMNPSHIAVFGM
jgi:hypothetical protein